MPVIGRCASALIRPQQSVYAPTVGHDFPHSHRAIFQMEEPIAIPPDFYELPIEDQERIKDRYRFWGIRLRPDLDDPVILTRQTLDIQ